MVLVRQMQVESSPASPARKSREMQPGWQLDEVGVRAAVATAGVTDRQTHKWQQCWSLRHVLL
jgi:hypothetical protein